ncbi:Aminopeptidase 2 mitochondrial [Conglomerata obtusa]
MQRQTLPHTIVPESYDLLIDTNTSSLTFTGSVKIYAVAKQDLSSFKLNASSVKINEIQIKEKKIDFLHENDLITINYDLKENEKIIIQILYEGKVSDEMNGYYVSKGEMMFSTHFEPTSARNAFPCFDQPDMKAIFNIMLMVPESYTALSNSEVDYVVEDEKHEDKFNSLCELRKNKLQNLGEKTNELLFANDFDKLVIKKSSHEKLVVFKPSPMMSTYLVAWVLGKLGYIERISDYEPRIKLRVYSNKEDVKHGKYALDVAHDCIKFFQDYFKIEYPLEKLDMVGIPEFAMGAMENWGLITYRKSSLLFNEENSPLTTKMNVADTVCHELAHQWFGNLATMKWWNDLWLNEGFATWAASLGVSNLKKELVDWDAWTGFISNDMEYGMGYDSLHSTHEIQVEVNDPEDIDQIFDGISYSKGASLIRMLEDYLGAEVFREGLYRYLKKFEYKNAETNDLWKELEEVSQNKDITRVMNYWTTKKGFPLIRVKDEMDKIFLSQERFYLIKDYQREKCYESEDKNSNKINEDVSTLESDDKNTIEINLNNNNTNESAGEDSTKESIPNDASPNTWMVPLRLAFFDDLKQNPTKLNDSLLVELRVKGNHEIIKKSNFYKFNNEGTGFYRVMYENHGNILKLLENKELSAKNRLNIMNDLFQLSIGSYISYTIPIYASSFCKEENNSDVIFSVLGGLGEIKGIFYNDKEQKERLRLLILSLVSDRISSIDFKVAGKDANETSLNTYIINAAVNNNDENCVKILKDIYNEYKMGKKVIDPSFRKAMFIAVMSGNNNNNDTDNTSDTSTSSSDTSEVTNNDISTGDKNSNENPYYLNTTSNFKDLWCEYLKETADDVKNIILSALGCSQNKEDINFLKHEFLKKNIKLQDKIYLITALAGNLIKRKEIINFVMEKYDDIQRMFGNNFSLFAYVIERTFSVIADEETRTKLCVLLRSKNVKGYERAVEKSLERSAIKIRFRETNLEK